MVNLFVELLEKYKADKRCEEALYLLYVSCISADSLIDVESCDNSLKIINQLEEAVNIAKIDEKMKKQWVEWISMAKEIINRDRETL